MAFKEKGKFQLYTHLCTNWGSGEIMDMCVHLCPHLQKETVIMNMVSQPGRIVHAYNTSTQKADSGRALQVQGQPGQLSEFGIIPD